MHKTAFGTNVLAIARAGAGFNNIPLVKCTDQGTVVFNTPGSNANAVKELVVASFDLGSSSRYSCDSMGQEDGRCRRFAAD